MEISENQQNWFTKLKLHRCHCIVHNINIFRLTEVKIIEFLLEI